MSSEHLLLAGGGHSHALLLLRWIMHPKKRPAGMISLINKSSSTLYSGMVPGVISGYYNIEEARINVRYLAEKAGVVFVASEIIGIDLKEGKVFLKNHFPISFSRISINVGSETNLKGQSFLLKKKDLIVPIRPLESSLRWLTSQDSYHLQKKHSSFTVIGSGFSGIEIALALRKRWPERSIYLKANLDKIGVKFRKALISSQIKFISSNGEIDGPSLLCTGNCAPRWLGESSLPVDQDGRVITTNTLQVINHPNVFAVGDCGVIQGKFRPPAGVWAVKAAKTLAINLESSSRGLKLISWKPKANVLQLVGAQTKQKYSVAWAFFGGKIIGPFSLLWSLKEFIDRKFMSKFSPKLLMKEVNTNKELMACRGCAAKLGAKPLKFSLNQVGLSGLGEQPEDSVSIAFNSGEQILQSVDGFPALISDPWLNGRLTTLHACSDVWACGFLIDSAQAVIGLPFIETNLQQELLIQTLAGIQSALQPQKAKLLGGHTFEARSFQPHPTSLGMQISLTINSAISKSKFWQKSGLQVGDCLLLSRELGSGVLFAAAMHGCAKPKDLDLALNKLTKSQHNLIEELQILQLNYPESDLIHACTDVTGFGLLGHLGEMLDESNKLRSENGLTQLRALIEPQSIPIFNGVLQLIENGFVSTLAPFNRNSWKLLEQKISSYPLIDLSLTDIALGSQDYKNILELIVDPQTCGPLLIACSPLTADQFLDVKVWHKIGSILEA